ncbi:MAG: Complex I intermediate-associated protein 30 (CIA30) [Bacteroidetes bacterium HLUCCA01]|nr:MAG: Complex I intermediate-associated protein 30 (CIA30) [Bacteroidetes bacterium HLUCCA01]
MGFTLIFAFIMVFNHIPPASDSISANAAHPASENPAPDHTSGPASEKPASANTTHPTPENPAPANTTHPTPENPAPAEVTLIDFTTTAPEVWQIVNDNVMGGVSRSKINAHADGFAVFSGTVSLRNNGGFASMRAQAQQPADLSGYEGLAVRVLGDGKVYALRLKTVVNGRITWYAFEANFTTVAGEWQTYYVPFSDFRPVYRGSSVRGNPPLNTDAIIELGFMIKDRQEGPFSLGIDRVKVYR